MKKMLQKFVALYLSAALLITGIYIHPNQVNAVLNEKPEKYIIKLKDNASLTGMKQKWKKKLVFNHKESDEMYLEKSSAFVIECTGEEAKLLADSTETLYIEKDEILNGSQLNKIWTEDLKDNITNYGDETEEGREYSYNPEEFVPCKAVLSQNENIPWNIAYLNGAIEKKDGEGVKIALIDSGIDVHNELRTKKWVDFSDKVDGYKPIDSSGHGTQMAGVIQAQKNGFGLIGLAPSSEVYSVKVLDEENQTTISSVIKAIEWSIANKVHIINMSFGTSVYSDILHDAIKKAYANGIILIAAAGNAKEIEYPAKFEEVITVGAINQDGTVASFSARGKELDFVAPGNEVESTNFIGSYAITTGTSIAAAEITGLIASYLSKNKNVNAVNIKEELQNYTIPLGENTSYGYGMPSLNTDINMSLKKENYNNEMENIIDEYSEGHIADGYIIKASWAKDKWNGRANSGHQTLINSVDSACFSINTNATVTAKETNRAITAQAACFTDEEYMGAEFGNDPRNSNGAISTSGTTVYSPYHAKSNYSLSTVKTKILPFLYEMARRRIVLGSNLDLTATNYNGNSYYGIDVTSACKTQQGQGTSYTVSGELMKRRIVNDLSKLYSKCTATLSGISMNTVEHKGYMVLGVYLHLLEDIYAHRAHVDSLLFFTTSNNVNGYSAMQYGTTVQNSRIANSHFASGKFANLKGYYMSPYEVNAISMIRLKDYLKDGLTILNPSGGTYTNVNAAGAYEDNPYFFSKRFEAATSFSKNSVNAMKTDKGDSNNFQFWNSGDVYLLGGYD